MEKNINRVIFKDFMKKNEYKIDFEKNFNNVWNLLRKIGYIILVIIAIFKLTHLYLHENKISFLLHLLILIGYGLSLFIDNYISYVLSFIITFFFGVIFSREHESLLLFYFFQVYVLLLFVQNILEKKFHNIIYVMPWTRFLWIFYFTEKFKEKSLFGLNANCYSIIALIFDTFFFFFYEKSKIENKIQLLSIWRLYNWVFSILYMIYYQYYFIILYIFYHLISYIANESVKSYGK